MADRPTAPVRRWRMTREGVVWLLIGSVMLAAGIYKTINLLILLGYLMLVLVGLNAALAYRMANRVTARRVVQPPANAGRPIKRLFVAANTVDRGASIGVLETSAVHAADVFVPALRSGEERWAEAVLPPARRGVYETSPLWVTAGYPFGLVRYAVAAGPAEKLVVLPALGSVDTPALRRWLIRTGAGDSQTRRPVRWASSMQADVRGLRTYRPGDSPRDIHWKTSARRNELTVREYDNAEPLELLLVVDPYHPAGAADDVLEAALSLAASVFWEWCHTDEAPHAALVLLGPTPGWTAGRASPGFGREALGLLAAAVGTDGPVEVPTAPLRSRSNRSARILVSGRTDGQVEAPLRRAAGGPFVRVDPAAPPGWYTPPPAS